jgi:hypothetical protein
MSGWSDSELARIGTADEIHIVLTAPTTPPAQPCPYGWSGSVTIYMPGPTAVLPAAGIGAPDAMAAAGSVSAAYRAKYGRYGSSLVRPMISDTIAETTLQLEPIS